MSPRKPTRSRNSSRPTKRQLNGRVDDLDEETTGAGPEPWAARVFPNPAERPRTDVAALRTFMQRADAAAGDEVSE